MKRSKLQRTDVEIDKCVICQLDLPYYYKSRLYWNYLVKTKDLELSLQWLKDLLKHDDDKEMKKEIREFKKNENSL